MSIAVEALTFIHYSFQCHSDVTDWRKSRHCTTKDDGLVWNLWLLLEGDAEECGCRQTGRDTQIDPEPLQAAYNEANGLVTLNLDQEKHLHDRLGRYQTCDVVIDKLDGITDLLPRRGGPLLYEHSEVVCRRDEALDDEGSTYEQMDSTDIPRLVGGVLQDPSDVLDGRTGGKSPLLVAYLGLRTGRRLVHAYPPSSPSVVRRSP